MVRSEAAPEPMAQISQRNPAPPVADQLLDACRLAASSLGGAAMPSIGVTSAIRGEGRSIVALVLALLQQLDYQRKVLLLEMDIERPALAGLLGLRPSPGLCEWMRHEVSVEEQVVQAAGGGMMAITAGDHGGHAPRIMAEFLTNGVLDYLAVTYDVVIADLPPLLGSSYSPAVADAFPQLLLVVRTGITPLPRLREATEKLSSQPAVLLNGSRRTLPRWLNRLIGS